MACTPLFEKGRAVGVICIRGPKPRPRKCGFCGRLGVAELLCDAELERVRYPRKDGSTTCDAPICDRCAVQIGPDRHLCPRHREQTRALATAPQQGELF